jgi:hypothetical protein
MTFQELLEVYNGQYIEIAGTDARNQCVDLANAYIKYVLRLPIIEWTNAKDFPSKAGPDYEYILNTPTGVPVEGDLVVWGGNKWGHIAIFIEGNDKRFTSFDENWSVGSSYCCVVEHNYNSPLPVIGWLHPKNPPVLLDKELSQCVIDRNAHWDFIINVAGKLGVETSQTIILAEIDKLITYEDKVHQQEIQLGEVQAKATEFANQAADKAQELVNLRKDMEEMKIKLDSAIQDNARLSKAIQELQAQ